MSPHKEEKKTIPQRIADIQQKITDMDLVCSGTLLKRTKVCGKPGCRCAKDPSARHGPYFEWSRREKGRLVHSILSEDMAEKLSHAIDNYRQILKLIHQWERESAKIILRKKRRK
jgi:hypothetical protein